MNYLIELVNPGSDSWTVSYVHGSSTQAATVLPGSSLTVLGQEVDIGLGMTEVQINSIAVRSVGIGESGVHRQENAIMHGAWLLAGVIIGLYLVESLAKICLPLHR